MPVWTGTYKVAVTANNNRKTAGKSRKALIERKSFREVRFQGVWRCRRQRSDNDKNEANVSPPFALLRYFRLLLFLRGVIRFVGDLFRFGAVGVANLYRLRLSTGPPGKHKRVWSKE